jgi:RNA recognition motif-containing protein
MNNETTVTLLVWHYIGFLAAATLAGLLAGLLAGMKLRLRRGNGRPLRTPELYVGNLPENATEQSIRKHLEKFGEVRDVRLISGRSGDEGQKTFAFVSMGTVESAQAAVNGTNGRDFNGRKLVVNEARSRRHHGRR